MTGTGQEAARVPGEPAVTGPGGPGLPVGGARLRRLVRERPLFVTDRTRRIVEIAVFAGIAALLLSFFRPDLLLSTTTATGGDTGAHVYTPWFVRDNLLPRGQISGWSHDWYAGFPILHFYFPLVILFQAVLSYAIPYGIAFKLGTVLGTFFLPVAAYLLLRLLRFRFPIPAVGAVVTLGFLFLDSFQIYGGNIPSTLAGEYSFSLSLGLSLVVVGLLYRIATAEDGRPVLAAGVLAAAVLSHLVPVMIAVLWAGLLLPWAVRRHGLPTTLRRLGTVFGLAFALTAFWSVPFLARLGYSADMHWFPLEGWGPVAPREMWAYLGAGALALAVGALRRDRRILLLAAPAALGLLLYFAVSPDRLFDGRVWNGRFLPFWYLGAILLTAYLVGTAIPATARLLSRRRAVTAALGLLGAFGAVIGGGVLRDRGPSYIDDWIRHNYAGYEAQAAFPTFQALIDRIERLPAGRVLWEPSPDLTKFGTPVALMTIPYWTGHPTMEGIYFESSITTPFHFLTAAEIAERPSNPIAELPYHGFDMQRGLRHMQTLGVSYFLAYSDQARRAASATPGLARIDAVGEFTLFGVDAPGQVVIPRHEPVILGGQDWIDANLAWFSTPDDLEVPLVADGPEEWARIGTYRSPLPRTAIPDGGRIVDAEHGPGEITFTTDAVGQPHWVRTSYFPNWKVEGARGPYLASPSMMLVVPTQAHVRLYYGRTWAEWAGQGLTAAAVIALVVPWSRRRLGLRGQA